MVVRKGPKQLGKTDLNRAPSTNTFSFNFLQQMFYSKKGKGKKSFAIYKQDLNNRHSNNKFIRVADTFAYLVKQGKFRRINKK